MGETFVRRTKARPLAASRSARVSKHTTGHRCEGDEVGTENRITGPDRTQVNLGLHETIDRLRHEAVFSSVGAPDRMKLGNRIAIVSPVIVLWLEKVSGRVIASFLNERP
jgi:hypothetical protein